jgi:DNA-binding NtrC family response regulator
MAKLLVIDDEPSLRAAVARYLRLHGHDVIEAGNGAEALRLTADESLDLVITDINMPEMDGIEVILALAQRNPGLPVIAMSGGGRMPKDTLLMSAELLGAVTTLAKPFELAHLSEMVEAAIGR